MEKKRRSSLFLTKSKEKEFKNQFSLYLKTDMDNYEDFDFSQSLGVENILGTPGSHLDMYPQSGKKESEIYGNSDLKLNLSKTEFENLEENT